MRYLEDFRLGDVYDLGTVSLTAEDILSFGRKYDPQPFHVDPVRAENSSFGGLVASGWQVAATFMRRYVDGLLADSACEGSPGVDEMRFLHPVRPGDRLTARVTVLGTAPSLARRDTGIVRPRCELVDQDGTVVFSMILHSIFRRRAATGGTETGGAATAGTETGRAATAAETNGTNGTGTETRGGEGS